MQLAARRRIYGNLVSKLKPQPLFGVLCDHGLCYSLSKISLYEIFYLHIRNPGFIASHHNGVFSG